MPAWEKEAESKSAGREVGLEVRRVVSAHRQVADELRTKILSGRLVPGDKLPAESRLGEMFGVSRGTVREALRVLVSQGLITTARGAGGGSFVATPDPGRIAEDLSAGLGQLLASPDLRLEHLLEVRLHNEPLAAALAAERATEDDLATIGAAASASATNPRLADDFAHHADFHEAVFAAADNMLLSLTCRLVSDVLRARLARRDVPQAFWSSVHDRHLEIADAIVDRAPQRAELLMRQHLEELGPYYLEFARMEPIEERALT